MEKKGFQLKETKQKVLFFQKCFLPRPKNVNNKQNFLLLIQTIFEDFSCIILKTYFKKQICQIFLTVWTKLDFIFR